MASPSSLFKLSGRSQSSRQGRSRGRLRAHTAAYSAEHGHITRSSSQRPSKNKLKSAKRPRANSVGKKSKNRNEYKVNVQSIGLPYLSNQNKKVLFALKNVQTTIQNLSETQIELDQDINDKFEKLMNSLNEQKLTLQKKLQRAVNKKKEILNQQQKELNEYKENFQKVYETFKENSTYKYVEDDQKQKVATFLNEKPNQKYNAPTIECNVSSSILIKNLEPQEIKKQQISLWGEIEVGEVPSMPPIFKINTNKASTNKIEIKCFEPKNVNDELLEITKFEIEYIQLPNHWKSKWKKVRKKIFDIVNNEKKTQKTQPVQKVNDDGELYFVNDDEKDPENNKNKGSSSFSTKIAIDKDKNFKNNVIKIDDLMVGCDYLIRARCYNVCGYSVWSSPKLISIYNIGKDGHWKFGWEYYTENMKISGNDKKTITKTGNKGDWDSLGRGPTFPVNFVEAGLKVWFNVKIENCAEDKGTLHFGIMSRKCKPEDIWSESIGFAEYESMGMEKYNGSPSFENGSIVKISIDFAANVVEFYESNKLLGAQKLNVFKKCKVSDLCFGFGSYKKKNSITLM